MKALLYLLLFFTVFSATGQEHRGLLSQETLIKNRVHTIFQYDASDSLQFMTNFPNGYYSIYNEDGNVILSNNYTRTFGEKAEDIWEEYKNYYFYNGNGDRIGFIQMYVDAETPFRMISLQSMNAVGDSIQTVTMETGQDVDNWGDTYFAFRKTPLMEPRFYFGDTILVSPFHRRSYVVADTTMFEDIFFNSSNTIDSTIFHSKSYGKRTTEPHFLTTTFQYTADNQLRSKTRSSRAITLDASPSSITTVNYTQNGLITSIETYYSETNSTEIMKYLYTFRE